MIVIIQNISHGSSDAKSGSHIYKTETTTNGVLQGVTLY